MKKLSRTQYIGIIYSLVWILLIAHYAATYMIRRRLLCFNDDAKSFIIFPAILQCLWIIIGLIKIFSKKDKHSSIGTLLVMLFITAIFNVLFLQLEDIVIYSRIERTNANLNTIRNGINITIEQLDPDHTGNPDLGESYIEMLNGCDIGKWHYAEDEFSQALAANIGINEYTELKYWLKTTDGYPIINVQIVDGQADVVLENAITR